jgi:hypothetical protein
MDITIVLIGGTLLALLWSFLSNSSAPIAVSSPFVTLITQYVYYSSYPAWVRVLHWVIVISMVALGLLLVLTQDPTRNTPASQWRIRVIHAVALLAAFAMPLIASVHWHMPSPSKQTVITVFVIGLIVLLLAGGTIAVVQIIRKMPPKQRTAPTVTPTAASTTATPPVRVTTATRHSAPGTASRRRTSPPRRGATP